MIKLYILGKVRGFLRQLTKLNNDTIGFFCEDSYYEIPKKYRVIISCLLRTRVIGFWGLFKVTPTHRLSVDCDYYLSYNRFVKSNKPYIIYLENPTALCHYSLTCLRSPFFKKRIKRQLENDNLIKIVCISKACLNSASRVLGIDIPESKITQIYPFVPENSVVTPSLIRKRCRERVMKLLFVAQGKGFYSKGGLEIIECYERIKNQTDYPIELTIITNKEQLDVFLIKRMTRLEINLHDFNFSLDEMMRVYATHTVLLQPSSQDSFGMTVAEAMMAGLPIISSDMYGFKEMVENEENGFVVNPAYRFFDTEDIPNPDIWNHRKKTIFSKKISQGLVDQLYLCICKLYMDREQLTSMSVASLEKARLMFGKEEITNQWMDIFFEREVL